MEFVEIKDKEQWNSFIMNNSETDILQSWQWGEAKRIEGWEPYRFLLSKNKFQNLNAKFQIFIAGQVLVKSIKYFGKVAYIPHGPFWSAECRKSSAELVALLILFREKFTKWAKEQDIFVVEIEPKIDVEDSMKIEIFKKAGFKISGRNVQPKYKLFLDISKSEDEIFAGMKKNTRYNIRYAQKHGVDEKSYSLDDPDISNVIDRFYELVIDMQKRAKGYPVRPKKYFEYFVEKFKDSGNIKIFEVSYKKEVIAMNISEFTNVWASSFYAGSNRLHTKLKASYLLRWASIQEAKKRGCKVYDFWGIVPDSKQHKGYSDNKLSFGGERVDFVGIWTYPINRLKSSIYELILKLGRLYLSLKWK